MIWSNRQVGSGRFLGMRPVPVPAHVPFTLKGTLSHDTTDSVFFHDGALVIPIHKTFVNKYHGTLKRYNYFGRGGLLPLAHFRTAVILLRLSKAADLVNNLFIFEPCVKVSYHMSFVAKNKP